MVLIKTKKNKEKQKELLFLSQELIHLDSNQCLYLPKADLNTKWETKQLLFGGRLVSFLVFTLICSCRLISTPSDAENHPQIPITLLVLSTSHYTNLNISRLRGFSPLDGTLFSQHWELNKIPKTKQVNQKWPFGFHFNPQLGLRQTQSLINTKKNKKSEKNTCSYFKNWFFLILMNSCICRKPSWTFKTKPNGHFFMACWFCYLCSTRFSM